MYHEDFLSTLLDLSSPGIHLSKLIFNSASLPCYSQTSSMGRDLSEHLPLQNPNTMVVNWIFIACAVER